MAQEAIAERMVPVGEGKATVADTPVTASENRAPSVLRVNLTVEEPSASIAHARICGGPERAIVRSTRPITLFGREIGIR